jgi:hypothetical protein
MSGETEPFGGQLCAELKRLDRLDLITRKLDYNAIQALKRSDRQQTVKLFQGSSYDFLQLLKTRQPSEIASHLLQQEQLAGAAAAMILMNAAIVGS